MYTTARDTRVKKTEPTDMAIIFHGLFSKEDCVVFDGSEKREDLFTL